MAEESERRLGSRDVTEPSSWVRRFAPLLEPGGRVLDVACGGGRHTRLLLSLGHPVTAVDIDTSLLGDIAGRPDLRIVEADLEGGPWPLAGHRFAGVVVTNFLWRPLLATLVAAVAPEGALIYETFARGNERLGRPKNADHLLEPGELIAAVGDALTIVAYEHGEVATPRPAVVQRICAVRSASPTLPPVP